MCGKPVPGCPGGFPLEKTREAIRRENLGGWLFSTLHGRDTLSISLLGLSSQKNSRPWYYLVFAAGRPCKIVHAIEKQALETLPGESFVYASREELTAVLRDAVLPRLAGGALACQYSAELPVLSFLDHGTALLLEGQGFNLVSSAPLVQRFGGLLDEAGRASHEEAALSLYAAVSAAWDKLEKAMNAGEVTEGSVLCWILESLEADGLAVGSGLIVAAGPHSGNPHYGPPSRPGEGRRVGRDEILQFDIWAKKKTPGAVYADISWVGFTGKTPPERYARDFAAIVRARDCAVEFIAARLASGQAVRGMDVDARVREILGGAGYGGDLRHRTGHGIDTKVHGCGVNLDSVEFPDARLLLDGSCFSVEPGVYFADYGMRTEINVIIKDGQPVVTGGKPQRELLRFR
jgi:Xaa-Pro aminopeptidase